MNVYESGVIVKELLITQKWKCNKNAKWNKEYHTNLFSNYWYPLGQRKVILNDGSMTFVSVIPAMVHQNLDSITN